MVHALRLAVVVTLLMVQLACGREIGTGDTPDGGPGGPDVPGVLGGRCTFDGFCNDPLVCVANVCVRDPLSGEGEGEGEGEGGEGEGEGEAPACADGDTDGDGDCNATDCDDNDPSIFTGANERCDDVDSNCNGQKNDLLDCTFLAHDAVATYAIDPFARTVTRLANIQLAVTGHSLLDIDIDVDGTLIAVTQDGFYEVTSTGQMIELVDLPAPPGTNGLAINDDGELFLTTSDGADSAAFKVDRTVTPPSLQQLGNGFAFNRRSSGDCVFTKNGDLLMSASALVASTSDELVEINVTTGTATSIGRINFKDVYGLSASFGFLFGVNNEGKILQINAGTGDSTVLFTTPTTVRFNGAANGD